MKRKLKVIYTILTLITAFFTWTTIVFYVFLNHEWLPTGSLMELNVTMLGFAGVVGIPLSVYILIDRINNK